jgi:hypothetical protein
MIASLIRWSARNVFPRRVGNHLRDAGRHLCRVSVPLDAIPTSPTYR